MDLYGSANGILVARMTFHARHKVWNFPTNERKQMIEPHAEYDHRRHTDVAQRLNDGEDRMTNIESCITSLRNDHAALRLELTENTALTRDIRNILETGRTFFRMVRWIGVLARWLAPIIVAWSALWAMINGKK